MNGNAGNNYRMGEKEESKKEDCKSESILHTMMRTTSKLYQKILPFVEEVKFISKGVRQFYSQVNISFFLYLPTDNFVS